MKIITIYELLGLVKDGKAPKKIKIGEDILNLEKGKETLYKFEKGGGSLSFDYYIDNNKLDDEVKILDIEYLNNDLGNKLIKPFLEEEKKIPEKICTNRIINTKDILEFEMIQNKINAEYTYAINSIVDYLKSKGDE